MTDKPFTNDDEPEDGWGQSEQLALEAYQHYEDGRMSLALDKLRSAMEMNPHEGSLYFNTALTLDALECYDEAIECFKQALEYYPDDPEILNCLAVDYTRTAQYDLAISIFEHIERIAPNFEPAYCNRIITYTEMELHEQAEQMFYLAQQLNPECPICFYNIGNSLFSRGLYGRAIWCWEKTASIDAEHPQINYRIAQAYWADGQTQKSQQFFLAELRRNPGDTDILMDYATYLMDAGQPQQAGEKLRWILELKPAYAPALFYLGELARLDGRNAQAMELYQESIDADGSMPGPRYRLAQLLLDAGNADAARSHLQRELRLMPDDEEIAVGMGNLFLRLDCHEAAIQCFLKAIDSEPLFGQACLGLGAAMMKKRDYQMALHYLEMVMEAKADLPQSYLYAALIFEHLEDYAMASQMLHKGAACTGQKRRFLIAQFKLMLRKITRRWF